MGVDGQDSTEPGGSNDDKIFFMKYPYPFLQYWYGTFPLTQQETIGHDIDKKLLSTINKILIDKLSIRSFCY